jgi:hypothetical protein
LIFTKTIGSVCVFAAVVFGGVTKIILSFLSFIRSSTSNDAT